MTNRKTEIEPLDGTPEKRMFWSIINDYDLQTGLTELIDNALDIWMPARHDPLHVEIAIDPERQLISIVDDAGGVEKKDLRLLIAPGGSRNSPDGDSIGIFGVGSKRAVVAIAEHVVIKTHHSNDRSYQIDITKDWLSLPDWEIPAYEIPTVKVGTTSIELSQLRRSVSEKEVSALALHFGETYAWFLTNTDFHLVVNGVAVTPLAFDSWAYPPGYGPKSASFRVTAPGTGQTMVVEIVGGLIRDRDPDAENYGVYFYCNNRLIVKHHKTHEVGYFVSSEAGTPHPDASLCRVIVRLNGSAQLMPWNSSKTGINYGHYGFLQVRPTLIQLASHFSSLSRRTKDDWSGKITQYSTGVIDSVEHISADSGKRLVLPQLPKVNKARAEHLKINNNDAIQRQPWTLGLVEAVAFVDIVRRQKLQTRNRIALILLDSTLEIALKEFIVHRAELFGEREFNDGKLHDLFGNRNKVMETVMTKFPAVAALLNQARHYYVQRNKLIHERATLDIPEWDIDNYRKIVEELLTSLFDLNFDEM